MNSITHSPANHRPNENWKENFTKIDDQIHTFTQRLPNLTAQDLEEIKTVTSEAIKNLTTYLEKIDKEEEALNRASRFKKIPTRAFKTSIPSYVCKVVLIAGIILQSVGDEQLTKYVGMATSILGIVADILPTTYGLKMEKDSSKRSEAKAKHKKVLNETKTFKKFIKIFKEIKTLPHSSDADDLDDLVHNCLTVHQQLPSKFRTNLSQDKIIHNCVRHYPPEDPLQIHLKALKDARAATDATLPLSTNYTGTDQSSSSNQNHLNNPSSDQQDQASHLNASVNHSKEELPASTYLERLKNFENLIRERFKIDYSASTLSDHVVIPITP